VGRNYDGLITEEQGRKTMVWIKMNRITLSLHLVYAKGMKAYLQESERIGWRQPSREWASPRFKNRQPGGRGRLSHHRYFKFQPSSRREMEPGRCSRIKCGLHVKKMGGQRPQLSVCGPKIDSWQCLACEATVECSRAVIAFRPACRIVVYVWQLICNESQSACNF
jgi:hypothetical protein